MNFKSKQFNDLKKHWYQVLKEDGFDDIEASETILKKESDRTRKYLQDSISWGNKQEYYLLMDQNFRQRIHEFGEELDLYIMMFWCKGFKKIEISKKLNKLGCKCYHEIITQIIRKYENDWGVRQWKPEQLNYQLRKKRA